MRRHGRPIHFRPTASQKEAPAPKQVPKPQKTADLLKEWAEWQIKSIDSYFEKNGHFIEGDFVGF